MLALRGVEVNQDRPVPFQRGIREENENSPLTGNPIRQRLHDSYKTVNNDLLTLLRNIINQLATQGKEILLNVSVHRF